MTYSKYFLEHHRGVMETFYESFAKKDSDVEHLLFQSLKMRQVLEEYSKHFRLDPLEILMHNI